MASIVNIYIAKRALRDVLISAAILTSIIMLVDLVEGMREYGSNEIVSTVQIFFITCLKTPKMIEQTIPFIVLFAIMNTLSHFNKRSELIVFRAAGVSVWNFLKPILYVAVFLGVFWAVIFNPIVALSETVQNAFIAEVTLDKNAPNQALRKETQKVWLREGSETGQVVILADSIDPIQNRLINAKFWIYTLSPNNNLTFTHRLDAKVAIWSPNYWQLSDVIENTATGKRSDTKFLSWPTRLSYEDVFEENQKTSSTSFWDLKAEIDKAEKAGFSAIPLRLEFQRLLALPLTLLAMSLIAAAATLHMSRSGGTIRLIITGCVLGFLVYFIDNLIQSFGQSARLNIYMAVWMVPIFVLICAIIYIAKIEDG